MDTVTASVRKHLTDIYEWQKLGAANIFPPESHLELIEGEIFEMVPIGSNHASHLMRLIDAFTPTKGKAIINTQNPLQLGDISAPEPDFMLLRPCDDFYSAAHPVATDVLLLIEIADSSIQYDQTQKLRLYAMHKIPEYWIVNLNDRCLEVYREPFGETYAQKTTLRTGSISLAQLPELTIQLSDIL